MYLRKRRNLIVALALMLFATSFLIPMGASQAAPFSKAEQVVQVAESLLGKPYKAGAKVLNVHIPRTGTPLNHDAVIASYREATAFFADYFQGEPPLIVCNSWLLNPQHDALLKPDSNIVLFANDYTIVDVQTFDDYSWLWRVFEQPFDGDVDSLPTDTSLRRAYAELLKHGRKLKRAYGVIDYAALCG